MVSLFFTAYLINSANSANNGYAHIQRSLVVDGYYIILTGSLWLNGGSYRVDSNLRFMDVRTEQWTMAPYETGQIR